MYFFFIFGVACIWASGFFWYESGLNTLSDPRDVKLFSAAIFALGLLLLYLSVIALPC